MSSVLKQITVAQVMSLKVYSISPDRTVAHAHRLMRAKHFGGLPVIEDGRLVGIITRKDVARVQLGKKDKTKVKDVMTKQVVTVSPDDKVSTAFEKMAELRVMRMPVTSKTGALVGVVTLTDINKASKTLQKRKLSISETVKCSFCGAPLKVTIERIVTCEYCGRTTNLK